VLSLGGHGYTEDELLTLLARETEGDASLVLGHELIAAKLNAAMGAPMPARDIDLADGLVGEYGDKLPLGVAVETYQGQGMVWAAAALAQANRRCGGAEGASDNPAAHIGGGTSSGRGPSGLPGTGGRLPFDSSKAGWIITVMSLIIGVLLVTLLRRTFEADEQ
jgi:hypothetical protein